MGKLATSLVALPVVAIFAGCSTSETLHHEGVTSYAGNAIRANTVLQMVDPWQYGVHETDLETPHERPWQVESTGASDDGGSDASDAKP